MSRNLKRRRVDIAPRRPDPDRWLCRLSIEVSNACNVFPSGRGMPINGTFMPKERTDALTARSRVKNGILDLDHPPPYNPIRIPNVRDTASNHEPICGVCGVMFSTLEKKKNEE